MVGSIWNSVYAPSPTNFIIRRDEIDLDMYLPASLGATNRESAPLVQLAVRSYLPGY